MNKTLLDEFAMAALNGWVSTLEPDATVNCETVAASLYDLAEAMMTERAKRMPQPSTEAVVARACHNEVPPEIVGAIKAFAGQKVTCSQVCEKAYGTKGGMTTLRLIGEDMRQMGFKKVRSGGKDYYQL